MSFRKPNNVFSTILSDVTQATTTLPGVGVVVTDNNIPAGAVVMVDAGMRQTTLATLATGDIYKIVQGKGADQPLMKSPTIVNIPAEPEAPGLMIPSFENLATETSSVPVP